MWKKPSIQKPDFNKANLNDLSERETLDTNGGLVSSSISLVPVLTGLVAPPIEIVTLPPRLSGVIYRPLDIIKKG